MQNNTNIPSKFVTLCNVDMQPLMLRISEIDSVEQVRSGTESLEILTRNGTTYRVFNKLLDIQTIIDESERYYSHLYVKDKISSYGPVKPTAIPSGGTTYGKVGAGKPGK